MSDPNSHPDPRTAATGAIAGCSVGAFAISVIFGQVVNGGIYLPIIVIVGAAIAISAVWIFGRPEPKTPTRELEELRIQMAELEKRLEAAETIEAFEDRLASREASLRLNKKPDTPD